MLTSCVSDVASSQINLNKDVLRDSMLERVLLAASLAAAIHESAYVPVSAALTGHWSIVTIMFQASEIQQS